MQNTLTIPRLEFQSYFNGPVAYIVICMLLLALGIFFFWWPTHFFLAGRAEARGMFTVMSYLLIFAAPAMTMALLAEEKRAGTIELLITMPVRDADVIIGKYLGVLGLYAVVLLLTLPYPISVSALGDMDWGPVWSGYLGLFLEGAAMLAIGLMASSWTENQLIAFFIALVLCMFFGLVHMTLPLFSGTVATVFEWLSLHVHFRSMARGVIDTRDLVYFLTVAGFALAVAFRSLESRRWR